MYKPFVIVALTLVVTGYHSSKAADVQVARPVVQSSELTEQKVIELARKAVQSNDTWVDRAKFEAKKNSDGTWLVTARRIPFVAGGHRFITISQAGKVTDYARGK